MKTATIYLSLGSNLGDRSAMLRTGIEALANSQIRVKKISSFYETEPVDFLDQPWFLNCVVEGETNLSPQELLLALRGIESLIGSKKEFAKGPRLLDMDILLYGDETIDTPELQIPHPRMLQRKFVLAPLAEIASTRRHPSWNRTASQYFAESTDPSTVRRL
jgi:2-amino-4-hydroxy-6-hydroxymethyldihydropteridine diphosphokinase